MHINLKWCEKNVKELHKYKLQKCKWAKTIKWFEKKKRTKKVNQIQVQ